MYDCGYKNKWKPGWEFTKLLKAIIKIFVTLGLKILGLFRLKVYF